MTADRTTYVFFVFLMIRRGIFVADVLQYEMHCFPTNQRPSSNGDFYAELSIVTLTFYGST